MSASTRSVLVVGDANVDLILRGDVVPRFGQAEQLLSSSDLLLGSSAGIVAHGLARLGASVSLVAVVGDDDFGRFTLSRLADGGVETAYISVHPTLATAVSVILSTPDDRSILTNVGAMTALGADDVRLAIDALAAQGQSVGIVHFASYFLLPEFAQHLPELLRELRGRGIVTSLDTNWDPAETWSGLADVLPLIDLFLPNLQELRAIATSLGFDDADDAAPDPARDALSTDERAARFLSDLGPRVVVKAGADGGWTVAAGDCVSRAAGVPVDVVDTTGAGDSFDAGYLAALASGVQGEAARVRWAAVAGSLSVRSAGGTSAQPDRAELTGAIAHVTEPV